MSKGIFSRLFKVAGTSQAIDGDALLSDDKTEPNERAGPSDSVDRLAAQNDKLNRVRDKFTQRAKDANNIAWAALGASFILVALTAVFIANSGRIFDTQLDLFVRHTANIGEFDEQISKAEDDLSALEDLRGENAEKLGEIQSYLAKDNFFWSNNHLAGGYSEPNADTLFAVRVSNQMAVVLGQGLLEAQLPIDVPTADAPAWKPARICTRVPSGATDDDACPDTPPDIWHIGHSKRIGFFGAGTNTFIRRTNEDDSGYWKMTRVVEDDAAAPFLYGASFRAGRGIVYGEGSRLFVTDNRGDDWAELKVDEETEQQLSRIAGIYVGAPLGDQHWVVVGAPGLLFVFKINGTNLETIYLMIEGEVKLAKDAGNFLPAPASGSQRGAKLGYFDVLHAYPNQKKDRYLALSSGGFFVEIGVEGDGMLEKLRAPRWGYFPCGTSAPDPVEQDENAPSSAAQQPASPSLTTQTSGTPHTTFGGWGGDGVAMADACRMRTISTLSKSHFVAFGDQAEIVSAEIATLEWRSNEALPKTVVGKMGDPKNVKFYDSAGLGDNAIAVGSEGVVASVRLDANKNLIASGAPQSLGREDLLGIGLVEEGQRPDLIVGAQGRIFANVSDPDILLYAQTNVPESVANYIQQNTTQKLRLKTGVDPELQTMAREIADNQSKIATESELRTHIRELERQKGERSLQSQLDRKDSLIWLNGGRFVVLVIALLLLRWTIAIFNYNIKLAHFFRARADILKLHIYSNTPLSELVLSMSPDSIDIGEAKSSVADLTKMLNGGAKQ
ncbi:hypothetical protein CEP88_09380 [Roseobacter denitrificans]|nr:hypothetical protein [Roseobacter denitrificans]AVL52791.1 hypothetical protein CEP88_09380 [Roseobacter denitrificans]SFG05471.1 hypothetical protein SAMN05443635_106198 [Roseobacter denitrificans OCh 114]